jgi:hypothetical protein
MDPATAKIVVATNILLVHQKVVSKKITQEEENRYDHRYHRPRDRYNVED